MSAPAARTLGLAQLVIGTYMLARPATATRTATHGHGGVPDLRIVRVLGARQAAQGAITMLKPDHQVAAAGAAVDALHAASLLPIIALSARYRRAASASATLATLAAAAGWTAARALTRS